MKKIPYTMLLVLCAFIVPASAATRYVPSQYSTIQDAIDAAVDGDEVVVADGVYTGIGNKNLDFGGRSITVRSENGPDTTIIDCENSGMGFNFHNNENDSSILNGFTITNGWAYKGGGIACSSSSPTIKNCIITTNYGREDGGGMYNSNSSPILSNCEFLNNTAYYWYGGGIYNNYSSPRITNCTFSGNSATWGGGISNRNHSSPIISSCVFTDNYANQLGGGIDTSYSSPLVEKCVFFINEAGDSGGGIYVAYSSVPEIKSCLFTHNKANRGGGIGNFSGFEFTMSNCTFYGNIAHGGIGGFIYNHRPLSIIENCIIWNNTAPEIVGEGSVLNFSCIKGGWPGVGNIDADPLFVDPNGADGIIGTDDDNLRLHADSPCIDAGDPNFVTMPEATDLDSNPRVTDCSGYGKAIVDMGAYENQNTAPVSDAGPNQVTYAWINGLSEVTLDGSASYDPVGDKLTYLWRWSIDNNVYEANGVSPTIELPVGQHTIELVVNDGWKDSEPNQVVIIVVEPIEGTISITPQTINRQCQQKRIMTMLRLPDGITKDQIDNNSTLLFYPGEVEAINQFILPYYANGTRSVNIFAFFDRDEILEAIGGIGPVQVYVVGQLKTGQYFYGSDTMRIIKPVLPAVKMQ